LNKGIWGASWLGGKRHRGKKTVGEKGLGGKLTRGGKRPWGKVA